MKNAPLIGAAALLAYGAWLYYQQAQEDGGELMSEVEDAGNELLTSAEGVLTDTSQTAAQFVDTITGGILKVSAMATVPRSALAHPNVQAMLRVIRTGEGTADANGYRRLFGGKLFDSYADHPRVKVSASGYTSTAAGAYQALASSWDETKRIMQLPDFSPASQDLFALGRIAARGALDDVIAGRFDAALKKISREWASLPYSPYGQPTLSLDRARSLYAMSGGETMYA